MEHNRNSLWFTTGAFATIALVAITSEIGKISDQEKAVKWAVSAISINVAFSGLAVLAIFALGNKFVGTMMEGGLALLTTGFWAAVMPAINDPDNNLAATGLNAITNANLYFFSWLALLTSFFIFFDFMKHKYLDKEGSEGNMSQVFSWAALMATSFVVLANASRLFKDADCDKAEDIGGIFEDRCKRTKLAVSVGVISTTVALVWLLLMAFMMKSRFGKMIDLVLVLFNVILWTITISYVTFGDKAPAPHMGNLYFFTWASFGMSVLMIMSSLKAMMEKGSEGETEEPKQKEPEHKEPESEHEMKGAGEEADTKDAGEEAV